MTNKANTASLLKHFKPSKAYGRPVYGYIYNTDGRPFLLLVYERYDSKLQDNFEYVKLVRLPASIELHFKGRVVMYRYGGLAPFQAALAAGLKAVDARVPSVDYGSLKTKALGISCGTVTFHTNVGELVHYELSCLGGDFSYSGPHDGDETWQGLLEAKRWSDKPIFERVDLSPAEREAELAERATA